MFTGPLKAVGKAADALQNRVQSSRQFAVERCEFNVDASTATLLWKRAVKYNSSYPWVKAALDVPGISQVEWKLSAVPLLRSEKRARLTDGSSPPRSPLAAAAPEDAAVAAAVVQAKAGGGVGTAGTPSIAGSVEANAGSEVGAAATAVKPLLGRSHSQNLGLGQRWLLIKALEQARAEEEKPSAATDTRYELGATAGEGTFGKVVRAVRLDSGLQVVIKTLKDTETPAMYLHEVAILSQLCHANIVELSDVQPPRSLVFIDAGVALAQWILDVGPSDLQRSTVVMRQAFSGASYIHALCIVHSDLKPGNICIQSSTMRVRLVDFGTAIVGLPGYRSFATPEAIKRRGLRYATLWYRSPELLLGYSAWCQEADVWALGCIFAELLTAEPTFGETSAVGQIFEIFSLLGSPDTVELPFYESLVLWSSQLPRFQGAKGPLPVAGGCRAVDELFRGLWALLPRSRLSANAALSMLERLPSTGPIASELENRPATVAALGSKAEPKLPSAEPPVQAATQPRLPSPKTLQVASAEVPLQKRIFLRPAVSGLSEVV